MESPQTTPLARSKTKRTFDKANVEVPFSLVPLTFGLESGHDRTPVVRKSSSQPEKGLKHVASALDMNDFGGEDTRFLTFELCKKYLVERVRSTLDVKWDDIDQFADFADFHIRAVCSQSHIGKMCFSFFFFFLCLSHLLLCRAGSVYF
jgi:hypothetical protein